MALSWISYHKCDDSEIPKDELYREKQDRIDQTLGFMRALDHLFMNFINHLGEQKTKEDIIQYVYSTINFARDVASMERQELFKESDDDRKEFQRKLIEFDEWFEEAKGNSKEVYGKTDEIKESCSA